MYSTFETGLYSSTYQVSKIHGFYLARDNGNHCRLLEIILKKGCYCIVIVEKILRRSF